MCLRGCQPLAPVGEEPVTSVSLIGLLFVRRYPGMPCAADAVNALDQRALASILAAYGEERRAGKIAAAIARARSFQPITRTQQLASIVAGTNPPPPQTPTHPKINSFPYAIFSLRSKKKGVARHREAEKRKIFIQFIQKSSLWDLFVLERRRERESKREPCQL